MTAMNEVNNDKTKSQEEYSRDPGHSKPSMDLLGADGNADLERFQRDNEQLKRELERSQKNNEQLKGELERSQKNNECEC